MEQPRPMSDKEAYDYIIKKFGSYAEYRNHALYAAPGSEEAPIEAPGLAGHVTGDYFIALAKGMGLTLEQFFAKHPDAYRQYRNAMIGR